MAHHSSEPYPLSVDFRKQFLGATGQFPEGKLNESDEGETRIAITHDKGKVVIDFGTATAWIGFTSTQAREIANALTHHADQIDVQTQEVSP